MRIRQRRSSFAIHKAFKRRFRAGYSVNDIHEEAGFQPEVYDFAKYLAEGAGMRTIIIIGGAMDQEKLQIFASGFEVFAIGDSGVLKEITDTVPSVKTIEYNLEKGLPDIDQELLERALVISSDIAGSVKDPTKLLRCLAKWSGVVPYLLLTTPDRNRSYGVSEKSVQRDKSRSHDWTINEFYELLVRFGFNNSNIGFTINTHKHRFKNVILAVAGREAEYSSTSRQKSVLAIMTVYNEEDIAPHVARHLLNEGLDIHIIDNWSTDSSYTLLKSLQKDFPSRVAIERYPVEKPKVHIHNWEEMLNHVADIAANSNHDWIIHHDSDEIRLSPWQGVTIRDAISYIDQLGYSAIDFTVMDFRPTVDGYDGSVSPQDFFFNFEFGRRSGHFAQVKGWKNPGRRVDLASTGGHNVQFDGSRKYPLKFINCHFSLRSTAQAKKKIFKERIGKMNKDEIKRGWHVHYNAYTQDSEFLWKEYALNKYAPAMFYHEYFTERLSGIGIPREDVT